MRPSTEHWRKPIADWTPDDWAAQAAVCEWDLGVLQRARYSGGDALRDDPEIGFGPYEPPEGAR